MIAEAKPTGFKIHCRGIDKSFLQKGRTQVPVIQDINLGVWENEFLVVLGPGQCGKSTLLRIIAGLDKPDWGEVEVDGQLIVGPGPERGMVFQGYMLLAWKTVMENVELGLKLQGIDKAKRREQAQRYIHLVGLEGFEKHYPHQLSGGMKQRVGLARSYVMDPEVMLMDEPFGQLDAQTRMYMQQETVRIWEKSKRTVVFVTNNIDEALFLADRIVLMEGKLPGRIGNEYRITNPRPREHDSAEILNLREKITRETELVL